MERINSLYDLYDIPAALLTMPEIWGGVPLVVNVMWKLGREKFGIPFRV